MSDQIKRSITISGHRTSISLERLFWECLKEIAARKNVSTSQLVKQIDVMRSNRPDPDGIHLTTTGLSSAIRVYVLQFYKTLTEKMERPAEVVDER